MFKNLQLHSQRCWVWGDGDGKRRGREGEREKGGGGLLVARFLLLLHSRRGVGAENTEKEKERVMQATKNAKDSRQRHSCRRTHTRLLVRYIFTAMLLPRDGLENVVEHGSGLQRRGGRGIRHRGNCCCRAVLRQHLRCRRRSCCCCRLFVRSRGQKEVMRLAQLRNGEVGARR